MVNYQKIQKGFMQNVRSKTGHIPHPVRDQELYSDGKQAEYYTARCHSAH